MNICFCKQVGQKFLDACKAMWMALKCENVWRPCLYMYISLALSLHIHEGMFYWYTDAKGGPLFSKVLELLSIQTLFVDNFVIQDLTSCS